MNISKLFEGAARTWPQRPALLHGASVLHDYATMLRMVRQRASWLISLGLRPGDRLVLCMGNRPEYLELLYAALWAGLAVTPVNVKLHAREVAYVLEHSAARAIVSDRLEQLAMPAPLLAIDVDALPPVEQFDEADMHASRDDDLAWLFYTSGTTGRPKGAMLTHANLLAMTVSYRSDVETVAGTDAYVYAAPISHGAGLYTFAYAASAARHVVPASGGFEPAEVLDLAQGLGDVCMFAAPTMVKRLVDEAERRPRTPTGIKSIVYGGGPMYAADIERALAALGPCFAQIYGQGETPMTITCMTREEIAAARHAGAGRLASVGRSHSVVEVRVVDEQGWRLPAGTSGEVIVRGATVMQGYWADESATASALRDGWLYTGDIGFFDADGYLTLLDRSKDVIISGGSNIYPREVEEVLLEHPAVAEAAVIGAHDAEWGEKAIAFIVVRGKDGDGVSDSELDALCVARIARFKRPKAYVRVDALPKNNNGKILKTELRARYAAMTPDSPGPLRGPANRERNPS
jgi:long-chain acyl-CoA synthetase